MRPATSGAVRLIHRVFVSPDPALNSLQTATARDLHSPWRAVRAAPQRIAGSPPMLPCGISRAKTFMPDTPVVLRMPPACVECGRQGTVKLQETIQGTKVALEWCCTECNAEWPVRRREEDPPLA